MSARGTLVLLVVALALGGWVYFGEIRGDEAKQARESAEKRLVALEPAQVTKLSLDLADGARARIARSGEHAFALEAPVAYPADTGAVERALEAISKLEKTGQVDQKPADLAPFGLAEPRKSVEVVSGDAPPLVLYLGGDTPVGGGRYAELGSDPNRIYLVSAGSLLGLTPTLLELRDKRLLRIDSGAADELTVSAGGTLVAQAKKAADTGWALVAPEAAPADAERVRRVLDDLSLARASGFADAAPDKAAHGLAPPALEVVVRAGEREERLLLGKADGKTWVERAGDPVLLETNERVLDNLPRDFFAYRAKRVQTLAAETVHRLELVFPRANETHAIVRSGEADWKAEEANVELKPLVGEDLLYAVAALDATGLEEASLDRKQIGLDPASVTVRAFDAQGALLGELSVGDPDGDKGLPALSSQSPVVWRVETELGRNVPLSPEAWRNHMVKAPEPAAAPEPASETHQGEEPELKAD